MMDEMKHNPKCLKALKCQHILYENRKLYLGNNLAVTL